MRLDRELPQFVNKGEGALSVVNAGKESTGRHPFGKVFNDFNSAQIQYQRSLDATQQLSNSHLRDRAIQRSQARIASMESARAYIRTNGNSLAAIAQAQEVTVQQFRQMIDRLTQKRPDLATSCP